MRPQFVFELCNETLRRDLNKKVRWRTECRANKRAVSEELFKVMREAGCYLVAFGIESANQKVLNSVQKDLKIQEIVDAIQLAKRAGLRTKGYFMIGNLSDDLNSLFETITFTKRAGLDEVQFTFFTPFPGSTDYNTARKRGWILNERYDFYDENHANIRTETLSPSDLEAVRELAYTKFTQRSVIRRLAGQLKRLRWKQAWKLAKFALLFRLFELKK